MFLFGDNSRNIRFISGKVRNERGRDVENIIEVLVKIKDRK